MRTFSVAVATLTLLIGPLTLRGAEAAPDVLASLRKGHPRLLVLDEDLAQVKKAIESDPTAKAYFDQIKAAGDKALPDPASKRELIGPRLLGVSRQALGRVTVWAGLYRLTGDKRYADRAVQELLAVAAFEDWHPPHFLDTAEMTNAVAIGYDWLFDVLTPEQRATLRTAIVEKGLKPGLKVYDSKKSWAIETNNWNQVCNGGMTLGALAIADEDPEIAREVIEDARKSIKIAMDQFQPDGGCVEGPGYWSYATRYTAYYLAALKTALNTDFAYLQSPGFADTGLFRIYSVGPIGRTFNYADAGDGVAEGAQMFWFARAFDRPIYAAHERRMLAEKRERVDPLHLLWFNAAGSDDEIARLPTAALFKRINVAFIRSGWNDPNAAFVGFKGGDVSASHAHADLGTFVYDVEGVRWAFDLGPDDYNLPGYFGKNRFDYYRLRSEGHNTLTIDGQNQDRKGAAPIVALSAKSSLAVADLSRGYPMAKHVARGVRLLGRQLLVQDEMQSDAPLDVVWHLHTQAKIELGSDPRSAMLTSGKKTLKLHIESSDSGHFEIADSDPPPATQPTPPMRAPRYGGKKLVIRQADKVTNLRLVVLMTPGSEEALKVEIEPLEKWSASGSLSP